MLAPALYSGVILSYGPAVEINLMSDCTIELSVDQIALMHNIVSEMKLAVDEAMYALYIFYPRQDKSL